MMQASSVTCPSLSGRPPKPTLRSVGSNSVKFIPFSIASKIYPCFDSVGQATSLAFWPKFQVVTNNSESKISFFFLFSVEAILIPVVLFTSRLLSAIKSSYCDADEWGKSEWLFWRFAHRDLLPKKAEKMPIFLRKFLRCCCIFFGVVNVLP